jgi:uncharacterized membrane protein
MKILKIIRSFLQEGTKDSMMRIGFLFVTLFTAILLSLFAYTMIIQAKANPYPGYELAALLGAIAALFTGAAYMKRSQKKYENEKTDHFNKPDTSSRGF